VGACMLKVSPALQALQARDDDVVHVERAHTSTGDRARLVDELAATNTRLAHTHGGGARVCSYITCLCTALLDERALRSRDATEARRLLSVWKHVSSSQRALAQYCEHSLLIRSDSRPRCAM
jgi:hypothetical protein